MPDQVADSLLAKWGSLELKLMEMIVIGYNPGIEQSKLIGKVLSILDAVVSQIAD